MRHHFFIFIFTALPFLSFSQSTNAPLNPDYYHWIDRYEIKQGTLSPNFHTSFKPYRRSEIARYFDSLSIRGYSRTDKFNQAYLMRDNWEWSDSADYKSSKPFLKYFYKARSDLFSVREKDFDLHLNPVLYLSAGNESASDVTPFINTRGVEVRGIVDEKVGFYSFIGENQANFPLYVREGVEDNIVIPGEGFWKEFKDDGYDFFTARGYISLNATRHIDLQFGYDQFFVGNGHRSLILSHHAPPYVFLKVNTQVWKIKYTNLFTELTEDVFGNARGLTGSRPYPKKYMAFHHLGVNIGKKFNIGVFESVVYGSEDSLQDASLELRYLNPIIFYRAIEQQNGSSDNVILGMDFKWLVTPGFSLYGQWVLDEFLLDRIREGNGWWGNKFGFQFGGEYVDVFGIENLDVQLETNWVRPYTFSHDTPFGSYSHYRQPLAHPIGANFKELVGVLRYQPIGRLNVSGRLIWSNYGADRDTTNWGGDILLNNTTREREFGNEIGQGVSTNLLYGDLTISFQFKHNVFFDLKHIYRRLDSEWDFQDRTTHYTSVAFRWNIPQRFQEF